MERDGNSLSYYFNCMLICKSYKISLHSKYLTSHRIQWFVNNINFFIVKT